MQKIKIAFLAYRTIATPALIVTIITSLLLVRAGNIGFLFFAITAKIISSLFLILYLHFFRSDDMYFFYNLGFSRLMLLMSLCAIDSVSIFIFYSFGIALL